MSIAAAASVLASANPEPARSASPAKVELVSHRGESYDAPENTLAAVRLAWERNMPAAELDVHLTRDGKLICVHDADTKRTAAGGTNLVVKESTAAELQKLDVGSWKGPAYAGEKMPLLDDVLPTIPAGRRLFIEVKVGPEAVPELKRVIEKAALPPEQTPIIAFNIDTVREAKKAMPKLKVYWLASQKKDKETGKWSPTPEEAIAKAKAAGLDGLDLSYKGPITADFVKAAKAQGLEFYVWTVDDPAVARRMIEAGVDGITTNRGQWMREQLWGK